MTSLAGLKPVACKSGVPPPRLEEAGADAVGEFGQIHKREEIDGLEFAVDGWRTADAAGNFEIGAEEARRALDFTGTPVEWQAWPGCGTVRSDGSTRYLSFRDSYMAMP